MKLNRTNLSTMVAGTNHGSPKTSTHCRSTLAIALASASLVGSALSQSSGTGTQTQAGAQATRTPVPGGGTTLAAIAGTGEMFLPDKSPTLVGYTFDYDKVNGQFVQGAKLFSVPLSDETGLPDTKVSFKSVFTTSSYELTHSTHYGVAGGLGVVKFAANLANSSEVNQTMLGTEFKFSVEAVYPPFKVDTITIPQSAFTPLVASILAIQNPGQRYQAWKAANFGDYVAYGYDLAGGIDFNFTMSQSDSFSSASSTFDASATYQGVTGTFGIASALKEIKASGHIGFDLTTSGCYAPPLPQMSDVINQDAQMHYAQQLNEWVGGSAANTSHVCKQRHGLWIVPISNMSLGINPTLPVWANDVMDKAAEQARSAAEILFVASKWNHSPSVSLFLMNYNRPGQSINFDAALDGARSVIAVKMSALKTAVFHYLDGNNAADQASQDAVDVAAMDVKQAVLALQTILDELRDLAGSLPAITVTLHEYFVPNNVCVPTWRPFALEIDNVAAFTNGTYQSISNWISRHQGDEASIVLRANESCDDHFNVPKYVGGEIQNLSIYETVYTAGLSKGLKKLTIPFMALTLGPASCFKAEVLDDFSRHVACDWIDAGLNN